MYCGDETGAFVGDIGYSSSRFGYGGEDCPKVVSPSWIRPDGSVPSSTLHYTAKTINTDDDDVRTIFARPSSSELDPNNFLEVDGIVDDMNAWECHWRHAFSVLRVRDRLKHTRGSSSSTTANGDNNKSEEMGNGKESKGKGAQTATSSSFVRRDETLDGDDCPHPLLAVDSGHSCLTAANSSSSASASSSSISSKQRAEMTEILIETFGAPAAFIAPSPMLMAFAHGRQSCLVLDIGGGGSRATPLVDGLILQSAQRRSGRGGEWLSALQAHALHHILPDNPSLLLSSSSQQLKQDAHSHNASKRRKITASSSKIHPRYAISTQKDGKKIVQYPNRRNNNNAISLLNTNFHRLAVADVMYEMKTAGHASVPKFRGSSDDNDDDDDDDERDSGNNADNTNDDLSSPVPPFFSGSPFHRTGNKSSSNKKHDDDDDDDLDKDSNTSQYELPDGTLIDLTSNFGKDFCRLPELFFAQDLPFTSSSSQHHHPTFNITGTASSMLSSKIVRQLTLSTLPIHKLLHASLTAVGDADVRKELCNNVILAGASSLYENMEQRLSADLTQCIPSSFKCRVVASRDTVERRYAGWIGGSVLTSLGSFQQLWLSRTEYEEYGALMGTQRFP